MLNIAGSESVLAEDTVPTAASRGQVGENPTPGLPDTGMVRIVSRLPIW